MFKIVIYFDIDSFIWEKCYKVVFVWKCFNFVILNSEELFMVFLNLVILFRFLLIVKFYRKYLGKWKWNINILDLYYKNDLK